MKILISVPDLKARGGVSNHYAGLYDFWTEEVKYIHIGRRVSIPLHGLFWLAWDTIKFIFFLVFFKPHVVVLNPSLVKNALCRDYYFASLALLFHQKVIVFFHGFNTKGLPNKDKDIKNIIRFFGKASCFLVLALQFKFILREWGITAPIYLTTTKVNDHLLKGFEINVRDGKIQNLLFLANVVIRKGIVITLSAFKILKEKYPYLKMRVVGYGYDFDDAKKKVEDDAIQDVVFTGQLHGTDLIKELVQSDLYVLPSFHEGMPTSVLEAMAFGLPVITRPVGGLVDFFQNGKMGEMLDSLEPSDFAKCIEKYMLDENLTKQTSFYNHIYAKENFMASKVAKQLEGIFNCIK